MILIFCRELRWAHHLVFTIQIWHWGNFIRYLLLFLNKISCISSWFDSCSPLLVIIFWLDFKFVGHSLALQFPIILTNIGMNNLFIFVNDSSPNLFLIVEVIILSNFDIVNHLLIIICLFFIILFLLLNIIGLFIGWFFEVKIFLLHGFGSQPI